MRRRDLSLGLVGVGLAGCDVSEPPRAAPPALGADALGIGFAFFNEIGIIDQLAGAAFAKVLPDGLTVAGFAVLNHFVRLGKDGDTPARLAAAFQVSRPTMTMSLQRLESLGLISLTPDSEDGRSKIVRLTAAGRAAREEAIVRLAPLIAELFQAIPQAELAAVTPTLARVRALLDAARG